MLNQETAKKRKEEVEGCRGGACKSLERSEGLGKSIAAASEQGTRGEERDETRKGKKEVLRG